LLQLQCASNRGCLRVLIGEKVSQRICPSWRTAIGLRAVEAA